MALRFHVLGSSSNGNCALIETEQTRILLDAGFSGRRLTALLKERAIPLETVEAVFLTHEHGDHVAGLRGLARHKHLQFYANYGTAQAAQGKLERELPWRIFETGSSFVFKDLTVETILLPHDAMEPVGYLFRSGSGSLFSPFRSLAWVTDLGHAPAGLAAFAREAQLLVLEANHDPSLLESDPKRPFSVKQRIAGRHGHLSNAAARDFLASVERPLWRRVMLAHLSRDCNDPVVLKETMGNGHCPWPVQCLDPHAYLHPVVDFLDW